MLNPLEVNFGKSNSMIFVDVFFLHFHEVRINDSANGKTLNIPFASNIKPTLE